MSTPIKSGSEFLVNTTTFDYQDHPNVAGLADGRFVVTWADGSNSNGGTESFAVRAQMFNADGSKSGAEFLVNTTTRLTLWDPRTTALADGRFVVTWEDRGVTGDDTEGYAVRAQVFNADGSKSGTEFLVNTTTNNSQEDPSITTLRDGRFVVTWTDSSITGGDTSSNAVRAQVFNADGSKSGAEFLVNTTTSNAQVGPEITALTDGRFVVAWEDNSSTGGDTASYAVRAQVFSADGSKSGVEFLVNTTTNGRQVSPNVTALTGGRFVVTWEDNSTTGSDTDSYAVRAQVFNADGSKSGAEFLVNTTTNGAQYSPSITTLADGRFVVAWPSTGGIAGDIDTAVGAQVFNADGSKSGAEFLVNTTTVNLQFNPSITTLADGRFVATWQDGSGTSGDTSGDDVRGQVFDPRLAAVSLSGTSLGDQWIGTGFDDMFQGKAGEDILDGGAGLDTASYQEKTAAIVVVLNGATAVGVTVGGVIEDSIRNIENITGGSGDDLFIGDTLSNSFVGGGGVDVALGEGGDDQAQGGEGNDYLYGGDGNDTLNGENGADALFGDAGNDVLLGGADADYIDGGTGNDYADGGDANDIFLMGADNDTVLGQAGNDYADLGGGDDYADGGAGEDILLGGLGNDVLLGGADADYMDAGDGFDYADGGDGNDIFLMGAGNDTAVGQGGIDFFDMGDGDDSATGGAGDDIFLGGAGSDTFDAGAGVDVALGAGGNDSYLVRSTSGLLLVYDFAASGAGDVLRLTADTGITSFAQAQAKLSFNASVYASVLTVDADTSVWLVGVTNAQLTAADFAFG